MMFQQLIYKTVEQMFNGKEKTIDYFPAENFYMAIL